MIPLSYLMAIILTAILLLYTLIDIPNKQVGIILNVILSMSVSTSWWYCIFNEMCIYNNLTVPIVVKILITLLLGILFGFIVMAMVWKEYPENRSQNIETVKYSKETLIGMTGTITGKYTDKSDYYLGKLHDACDSDILVYLGNKNIKDGETFIVDKIEDGIIYGSLIKKN